LIATIKRSMSVIGSPIETSALQAIQAQQAASKARDREKAQSATGRRFNDLVELRVAGLESTDAIRGLPKNDSEQSHTERQSHQGLQPGLPDNEHPHVDVTG
jgi:hypothetical protein